MNRIFHAKVPFYKCFFIALLALLAVWSLWEKHPVWGGLLLVWLVVVIEQVIHTTYTITNDGRLIVSKGRFSKVKELPLSSLRRVEKIRPFRIGSRCLISYLLVVYMDVADSKSVSTEKSISVQPVNEEEFLAYLEKKVHAK